MKKMISVLLVLVLLVVMIPALGEGEPEVIDFELSPYTLEGVTFDDWFETSYGRAALTICINADIALGVDNLYEEMQDIVTWYKGSAVARCGDNALCVYFPCSEADIVATIEFDPLSFKPISG